MASLASSPNDAADKNHAIDVPHLRGPRGDVATALSHVEARTRQISSWPLRPSQAVRRKQRWSPAKPAQLDCFVFLGVFLCTVEGNVDSIFLYFGSICCQALIAPFTWENMCVCEHVYVSLLVGCSEPWHPADGFIWHSHAIWRMFLLPSVRWSAVIWAETEGDWDVSFFIRAPGEGGDIIDLQWQEKPRCNTYSAYRYNIDVFHVFPKWSFPVLFVVPSSAIQR